MDVSRNVLCDLSLILNLKSTMKYSNNSESIASNLVSTTADALLTSQQIVFIDSQVEDYQSLAAGVVPGIDVVVLERDKPSGMASQRDGIEQITTVLAQYSQVSTIHIVSHGSPGCIYLGNAQLSLDTLNKYQQALQTWFNPFCRGNLFIYGCNVAAGDGVKNLLANCIN